MNIAGGPQRQCRGIILLPVVRGRGSSSMVEHRLPKPVVAGSIPVSRSRFSAGIFRTEPYCPYCPENCGTATKAGQRLRCMQKSARAAKPCQSRDSADLASRQPHRACEQGRTPASQAGCHGFDPRLPLHKIQYLPAGGCKDQIA